MAIRRRIRALAVVIATVVGVTLMGAATPANAQVMYEGKVTSNTNLAVRSLPTVAGSKKGSVAPGATIQIVCKVEGTTVGGNPWWYALPPTLGEWVSARYVDKIGSGGIRICGDGDLDKGRVATASLAMRTGPTTDASSTGSLARGKIVNIRCKLNGQVIDGNPRWYHLANGRWLAARYVANVGSAPVWCN